nr:cache domain-containing protein [Desulfobulbus sp.]
MKRLMAMLYMVAVVLFATQAFSADKEAITKNVDEVVAAINGGKGAASFAPDAYTPYAFIMEAEGKLIVHPTLAGKDLKVEGMPIYEAIKAATPQGGWVKYVWKEKEKNTYIKRTNNNLIVGSGY